MIIKVKKITDETLARETAKATTIGSTTIKQSLLSMYKSEHSPIRSQLFLITMIGIPTSVSVHFVRHKIGVEHFVQTNRPDRGGDGGANRNTPVNHAMLINAQSLIDIAKIRLCNKAEKPTREIMGKIVRSIKRIDPALASLMVPKCVYRNGICCEPKPCGSLSIMMKQYGSYLKLFGI